jgi:hypothetical protein
LKLKREKNELATEKENSKVKFHKLEIEWSDRIQILEEQNNKKSKDDQEKKELENLLQVLETENSDLKQ